MGGFFFLITIFLFFLMSLKINYKKFTYFEDEIKLNLKKIKIKKQIFSSILPHLLIILILQPWHFRLILICKI